LITIRDLHSLRDYAECVALQDETWGAGFSERVPTAILRVSQMIGGVAAGAFDESDRLLGFVFGLTGIRNRELVHWSDMLAVREELRSQGIGERLKQYQRDKVLALGARSMLWTFDPLQAGNAHFNINRLGALPIEYIPDMYGNTGSALHGTLPTDRFVALFVGRDVAKKGLDVFLAAGHPSYDLVAVTDRVATPGGATLLTFMSPDRLQGLLSCADAFVLPSEGEGLPLSLQEALAAGVPVVTTRQPGYDDFLSEDDVVYVDRDPCAVRAALRHLATDGELQHRLSERGRQVAERHFGFERFVGAYEALYEEAVDEEARDRITPRT